ncbi:Emopamil-binding protein-like [Pseudocercospora fuligena]|uniref:Emopamil-binding protein-like n=1 Tax=Pseudocercospora fuligena TaxID=685502 RepID=A0A8H6RMN2_9PEZI|nr:Emopamil-binding protein-like [Pseudocercospora fuligena]
MATVDPPSIISTTTILSLLSTVLILGLAYTTSLLFLPKHTTTTKLRLLFIWHAFDALIHFILEGGYLYNCFFSYRSLSGLWSKDGLLASAYLPPNIYFLGHNDRLYGSEYGTNPLAKLWMEYAKADARWGGSDLTIISLEILTVFVMAPLSVYICDLLRRGRKDAYFWMIVVATGELYGGFMTFAPEWLTGNPNLDASNWMYLWLYLVFFNAALWVLIPLWVLYEAHGQLGGKAQVGVGKKVK